uniref:Putative secreted protein n=1 Tax=Ixodes ricinus TaxID=34613 RepID=A0A6B0UHT2_IXORI
MRTMGALGCTTGVSSRLSATCITLVLMSYTTGTAMCDGSPGTVRVSCRKNSILFLITRTELMPEGAMGGAAGGMVRHSCMLHFMLRSGTSSSLMS